MDGRKLGQSTPVEANAAFVILNNIIVVDYNVAP